MKKGSCEFGDSCKYPHMDKADYDKEVARLKAAAPAVKATTDTPPKE